MNLEKCKRCLVCVGVCPVKAISIKGENAEIDKDICIGCGCCASSCPNSAIDE
ncbi:MAG: 4Fe-4S binding protein [Holosporaceae bacterium]|nr:4Fe-4S binding protein [Holosporaceae bacterium]